MDDDRLFEIPDDPDPPDGGHRGTERDLDRRLATIPAELSDVFGLRIRAALDAVQDRTAGSIEGLRSAVAGVEERVTAHLTVIAELLEQSPLAVRDAVRNAAASIRGDLEVVQTLPQHVARALKVMQEAVAEIAGTEEAVGRQLEALNGAVERIRGDVAALAARVDQRITRLDALSGVLESLAQKRGFKDLIRSERKAVEQQERFVRDLTDLGGKLSTQLTELSVRVEHLAERIGRVESQPPRA
ncbi:MAG TPA: hypothetical protein VF097_02165 [Actinomycetota bacterium]